jgi:MFS family permease
LIALGALAFCILAAEGAMADWTAVYLKSVLGADARLAAMGYAVFSSTMVIGRLSGDWLTVRMGRARLVRTGATLASVGLAAALLIGSIPATLAGFAAVGLGLSVIVPLIFRAAASGGSNSGTGLAAVTTTGYLGFLTGPPLIGGLAQWVGLRLALVYIVFSIAIGAVLARRVEPATSKAPDLIPQEPKHA